MPALVRQACLMLLPMLALAAFPLAAAAQETPREAPRVVTVSGTGEAEAMPDRAQLSFGAEARGEALEALRAEVHRVVDALLEHADTLGIESQHVTATDVRIRPEYEWNPRTGERRFVGYYVLRQVQVELHDLELLGALIEGAVDRGVNQLADPVLEVGDREALRRRALARAAEDARANAEVLATTLGASLGEVREITAVELEHFPPRPMPMADFARMAESAPADARFEVGQIRFRAHMTAQFDLAATR